MAELFLSISDYNKHMEKKKAEEKAAKAIKEVKQPQKEKESK